MAITVTVQMDLLCDDPALQRFHPTNSLVARNLISLQNVSLTLQTLQVRLNPYTHVHFLLPTSCFLLAPSYLLLPT